MNLIELVRRNENHPIYRELEDENLERHYGFLFSIIKTSLAIHRPFLSTALIKALNFHAIVGLYESAGDYRPGPVRVGRHQPALHYKVSSQMNDCVNQINWLWQNQNTIRLAAWALWRINWIHPFENGNGRTARAVCYFIVCVKSGMLLPGTKLLPELLKRDRERCVNALQYSYANNGDCSQLATLIRSLIIEQTRSNS